MDISHSDANVWDGEVEHPLQGVMVARMTIDFYPAFRSCIIRRERLVPLRWRGASLSAKVK
jgi:hypothetical protein